MLGWLGAVAGASGARRPWAGVATCVRLVRVSSSGRRGAVCSLSTASAARQAGVAAAPRWRGRAARAQRGSNGAAAAAAAQLPCSAFECRD